MVWRHHNLFNYSPAERHLGCFLSRDIKNKTTINLFIDRFLCECKFSFLWNKCPRKKNCCVCVCLCVLSSMQFYPIKISMSTTRSRCILFFSSKNIHSTMHLKSNLLDHLLIIQYLPLILIFMKCPLQC